MANCTTIVPSDLRLKHKQMRESPFQFLRGTFYRWAQLWPSACSDLCEAPTVLAVGDLHVNSFGTWRDAEGRLCWGVDDFDESYRLPYTNDLVRLAASMKIVIDAEGLAVKLKEGCELILEGYTKCLKEGGHPLVLAEREQNLERLGVDSFKPPTDFWGKLNRLPPIRHPLKPDIKRALREDLARSKDGIQSSQARSRIGKFGAATVCGDRGLAGRLCCQGSQSYASVGLCVVEREVRPCPVLLPTCNCIGGPLSRSVPGY